MLPDARFLRFSFVAVFVAPAVPAAVASAAVAASAAIPAVDRIEITALLFGSVCFRT